MLVANDAEPGAEFRLVEAMIVFDRIAKMEHNGFRHDEVFLELPGFPGSLAIQFRLETWAGPRRSILVGNV